MPADPDAHQLAARDGSLPKRTSARARQVAARSKEHTLIVVAAGIAFFGVLALMPALIAVVSVYAVFADPDDIRRQLEEVLEAAPTEARELVLSQLESVAASSGTQLGLGAALGVLAALWSASSGVNQLIKALNVTYDEAEDRGWIRVRLLSLGLTVAGAVFVIAAVAVLAVVPSWLDTSATATAVNVLRWPVLGLVMVVGLGVVYRVGPSRPSRGWRWLSWGALVATLLWLVGSAGFSVYAANFGAYNETYGVLTGFILLMVWLLVTAAAILVGAEVDATLDDESRVGAGADHPPRRA